MFTFVVDNNLIVTMIYLHLETIASISIDQTVTRLFTMGTTVPQYAANVTASAVSNQPQHHLED